MCVCCAGYGHTTPLSDMGKVFSIVYALLGVPFTMLVLTACVQRLMYPLVAAPLNQLQRCGLEARRAAGVHFLALLALVLLCFFAAPAVVFHAVEGGWSFLDGFYFCFISLCTIGLGDFVPAARPGQNLKPLYQVAVMGEYTSRQDQFFPTRLESQFTCENISRRTTKQKWHKNWTFCHRMEEHVIVLLVTLHLWHR